MSEPIPVPFWMLASLVVLAAPVVIALLAIVVGLVLLALDGDDLEHH